MFKRRKISEISFLEILKKAWKITWTNKFLWWLGALVSLTSLNLSSGTDWSNKETDFSSVESFWSNNWEIILVISSIIFLLFLVFIFLSLIGRGGLISAILKLDQNKKTSFKSSFQEGKGSLKDIFILNFILFLAILMVLLIVSLPVIYCILNGNIITGIIIGILALLIFIISLVLISYLKIFGQIYLVLGKIKSFSSLENAYKLFLANPWSSILMGILMIPVSMVAGILTLGVIFVLALIFLPVGISLWLLFKEPGVITTVILAIPFLLAGVLFISSIFQTFRQASWILFFKEIAQEKETEKIKAIVSEKTLEDAPLKEGMAASEID